MMADQPLEVTTWPLMPAGEELGPMLPCPICGAAGACDYTDDGRPLLHCTPLLRD